MPTLRSSRFLRAPEKAEAIAAAPPQRHDDEADEGRRHAQVLGRLLHRFDEDLADQRHQHRDAGQRGQRQAGGQGGERDQQLGQVAQRGIQQPAGRVAGLGCDRFGGMAQQCGQWHDGQHRQHEQQRMRLGLQPGGGKHRGHEDQQPQQRVAAQFVEQGVLGCPGGGRLGDRANSD
jgi:hypothetical protein